MKIFVMALFSKYVLFFVKSILIEIINENKLIADGLTINLNTSQLTIVLSFFSYQEIAIIDLLENHKIEINSTISLSKNFSYICKEQCFFIFTNSKLSINSDNIYFYVENMNINKLPSFVVGPVFTFDSSFVYFQVNFCSIFNISHLIYN